MATPLETWVYEAAKLTKPDRVVYCDGSEAEYQRMIAEMLRAGDSFALNEKTFPNCHLHRSSPNDVARTEHLTFICSPKRKKLGPRTIGWILMLRSIRWARSWMVRCAAGRCMWCRT